MCRFPKLSIYIPSMLSLTSCFGICFLLSIPTISAQDDILKPVGNLDLGDLFGEEMKAAARLLSETDETLNIELKYEGFVEADEYIIRGEILNAEKKPMKEFMAVKRTAGKGSGSVDLGFQLKLPPGKNYKQAYISSGFLKITIYDKKEDDEVIEIPGVEFISFSGNNYLFEYQKKWRIGGSESMKIPVTLTPIGKAKNSGY